MSESSISLRIALDTDAKQQQSQRSQNLQGLTLPCVATDHQYNTMLAVTPCRATQMMKKKARSVQAHLCNRSKTESLCPLSVLDTDRSRPDCLLSRPDPCLGRASALSAPETCLSKRASRMTVSVPALSQSASDVFLSGGLYEMGACFRRLSACPGVVCIITNMQVSPVECLCT